MVALRKKFLIKTFIMGFYINKAGEWWMVFTLRRCIN